MFHKKIKASIILLLYYTITLSQEKSISITIDDVPNSTKYQKDYFKPILLNKLDSLAIPFTIFVNEDKVYKTKMFDKNKNLLLKWIENKNATIGNHTNSHLRYSEVGFENFVRDIKLGEKLIKKYASKHNKKVKYFRFPFNDLGKDSVQHMQIRNYLKQHNYVITPFTVESSDWMFDTIYQYYLSTGEIEKAKLIGLQYVNKTIELIKFYDKMVNSVYNRSVKHIYLCHDNAINADYLPQIISILQQEKYKIVSLEESLTDPVYKQNNRYYKKWGISWLYRWMYAHEDRIKWMKQEPTLIEIENMYKKVK